MFEKILWYKDCLCDWRYYKSKGITVIMNAANKQSKIKTEDEILSRCYENALKIAEEYEIDSVAFPVIST